jgi:hypothetical protein
MREITVGVVAPAYVNVPLWVAQERGFLERAGSVPPSGSSAPPTG